MKKDWVQQLADELHKPIRRKFIKRRVVVNYIDKIWCSDLVEMIKYSKMNEGYKYLLMILDVFSKYGWIIPIKDKKGATVTEAFKKVFSKGRKPEFLWVDKGKEFYNNNLKNLLNKNKITMYSTENEEKASICERWNRTIKTKIWKQFTIQNNRLYLKILPQILKEYNNTFHRSIKMTPAEASEKKNEEAAYLNLYDSQGPQNPKPKFKVGDRVRISKFKRQLFDKGYTPNWTEEIFTIDEIQPTNPITYKIMDMSGDKIKGSFYEPELLKTTQEKFRIEKIIKKDQKKKQAFVKWKGYSNKFNSWIPLKD